MLTCLTVFIVSSIINQDVPNVLILPLLDIVLEYTTVKVNPFDIYTSKLFDTHIGDLPSRWNTVTIYLSGTVPDLAPTTIKITANIYRAALIGGKCIQESHPIDILEDGHFNIVQFYENGGLKMQDMSRVRHLNESLVFARIIIDSRSLTLPLVLRPVDIVRAGITCQQMLCKSSEHVLPCIHNY